MSTRDIARDLVKLCQQGKFAEAGEKHWADNVLSVEAMGDNPEIRGKDAVRKKGEGWESANTVHGFVVEGPYVNGERFVVRFKMDISEKASGKRQSFDEVGLYTVRNGKITEERFFPAIG